LRKLPAGVCTLSLSLICQVLCVFQASSNITGSPAISLGQKMETAVYSIENFDICTMSCLEVLISFTYVPMFIMNRSLSLTLSLSISIAIASDSFFVIII